MRGGAPVRWIEAAGVAALLLCAGAGRAEAQSSLADYDYANLGLQAIGAEVFWVDASQNDGTLGIGARADFGFLGPFIRIVPRFAWWEADVNDSDVRELEESLAETCTGDCTIALGSIERTAVVLGLDAQWTLADPALRPYLGVGLDVYLLDDSGAAIEDTFLDDTVVTAGASGVLGLELNFQRHWRVYTEVRGTLVTDANNWNLTGGFAWRP
ncbi:MAG: outer membrane beta-barrel protein [Gemmatimonadota bacterium]|nr:outer membrane beta-barrel protein [Gemmatimonadota bacterium]